MAALAGEVLNGHENHADFDRLGGLCVKGERITLVFQTEFGRTQSDRLFVGVLKTQALAALHLVGGVGDRRQIFVGLGLVDFGKTDPCPVVAIQLQTAVAEQVFRSCEGESKTKEKNQRMFHFEILSSFIPLTVRSLLGVSWKLATTIAR